MAQGRVSPVPQRSDDTASMNGVFSAGEVKSRGTSSPPPSGLTPLMPPSQAFAHNGLPSPHHHHQQGGPSEAGGSQGTQPQALGKVGLYTRVATPQNVSPPVSAPPSPSSVAEDAWQSPVVQTPTPPLIPEVGIIKHVVVDRRKCTSAEAAKRGFGFHLEKTSLKITSVDADSSAEIAGLKDYLGYILTHIDGLRVTRPDEVHVCLLDRIAVTVTLFRPVGAGNNGFPPLLQPPGMMDFRPQASDANMSHGFGSATLRHSVSFQDQTMSSALSPNSLSPLVRGLHQRENSSQNLDQAAARNEQAAGYPALAGYALGSESPQSPAGSSVGLRRENSGGRANGKPNPGGNPAAAKYAVANGNNTTATTATTPNNGSSTTNNGNGGNNVRSASSPRLGFSRRQSVDAQSGGGRRGSLAGQKLNVEFVDTPLAFVSEGSIQKTDSNDSISKFGASGKKRSLAKMRWDRALSHSIEKVVDSDGADDVGNASAVSMFSIRTIGNAAYELILLVIFTFFVTLLLAFMIILWLRVAEWYQEEDASDGVHIATIGQRARTNWAALELLTVSVMHFATTFCLVPAETWRWVVTLKTITALTGVLWLHNEKVHGMTSDNFLFPALLILLAGVLADILYLIAAKRKRPWVVLISVLFPIGYALLTIMLMLHPYWTAPPWLKLVLSLVVFPLITSVTTTILSVLGRHYADADLPLLSIATVCTTFAVSSCVSRVMILRSPRWVQIVQVVGLGIYQFIRKGVYLKAVTALDSHYCQKFRGMPHEELDDWYNGAAFQEYIGCEHFFEIVIEFSSIVGVNLMAAVAWGPARNFFDYYSPDASAPGAWFAFLIALQFGMQYFATVIALPLQRNHTDFRLP
eukprot:gene2808-4389_t